jgi:uncharacterized BrkB/YihY/UPF0761 family membrane protein
MPLPRSTSRTSIVLRVLAGVVAAVAVVVFVLATSMVLSSRFGWDDRDVHGYGLLFGTPFAIVAGLVAAVALPLAVPPGGRGRTRTVTLGVLAAVVVLLVVAVATA